MIKSVLLKRCYSSIKANFYINELNNNGIYAFLINEHTTDLIPFGDGGYMIHVEIDRLAEATKIIEELENNEKREEDFTEATKDDIAYEKLKNDRKVESKKRSKIMNILLLLVILILLLSYLFQGRII